MGRLCLAAIIAPHAQMTVRFDRASNRARGSAFAARLRIDVLRVLRDYACGITSTSNARPEPWTVRSYAGRPFGEITPAYGYIHTAADGRRYRLRHRDGVGGGVFARSALRLLPDRE